MGKGKRYVIGDIHGCVKSFRNMVMEKIRLTKDDTLFLLGDYIDRGPDSKSVLDFIMELQRESYTIRPIMGNHEYMLLKSLDEESEFITWKKNGSTQTLLSFGIPEEKLDDPASVRQIPGAYINFLSGLSFFEETDDFYFVHAGLGKGVENPKDDLETLFWSRKEHYNRSILKGRILIHGHTPVSKVSIQDRIFDDEGKILNLDGGCVYPHVEGFGNLVGLDLDSFQLFFQENIE
jgi:serine/threonine protein phosphatase 1